MDSSLEPPTRLRLISTIVIVLAVARVILPLLVMVFQSGFTTRWLMSSGVILVAGPAVWAVAAWLLRRGSYGAALTLIIFPAGMLLMSLGYLLPRPVFGLMYPVWLVSSVLLPAAVLAMGIWARRETGPSAANAVRAARRRAGTAMRFVAALIVLLSGAIVVFMYAMFGRTWNAEERIAMTIAAAVLVATLIAAPVFTAASGRLRREQQPGMALLVVAGIVSLFLLFCGWALRGAVVRYTDYLALAMVTWLMVDLLHARRTVEEPLSYGFEPILSPPPAH